MDFVNGRGDKGLSATLNIVPSKNQPQGRTVGHGEGTMLCDGSVPADSVNMAADVVDTSEEQTEEDISQNDAGEDTETETQDDGDSKDEEQAPAARSIFSKQKSA